MLLWCSGLPACPFIPPSFRWRVDFNRTDLKHGAFEPQEKEEVQVRRRGAEGFGSEAAGIWLICTVPRCCWCASGASADDDAH